MLGDRVSNKLCIDLRLADFLNVDVHHLHAKQFAKLGLEHLDVLAFFSNYDTGACAMDGYPGILCGPFDNHATDGCVR